MRTLFKTNIGSHMWRMNTPESDVDIFECYIAPSEDFLVGMRHKGCHHSIFGDVDQQSAEIGTVVYQITKNNCNYLWNVLSPIQINTSGEHKQLIDLTMLNLSKVSFHSINGLAVHNYKKYIINGKGDSQKRRKTIMRSLNFGITLLRDGKIEFEPIPKDRIVEIEDIPNTLTELHFAWEGSKLPETPQHLDELYDWLLKLRIRELKL